MDQFLSPLSSLGQIPWTKLIYSALLLFIAGVLIAEVVRIWGTNRVYIGDFKYYVDGKNDDARAQTMRALILYQNRAIADGFSRELQRRRQLQAAANAQPQDAENVWLPKGGLPISDSASAFSNVELTVQGINFTQIMTALRRTVSPPNEITGTIGRTGDKVSAMVQWPRAPERPDGLFAPAGTIPVEGARDDAELAFDIACSLIWTEAVADATSKLIGVDRVTFCAFANAWSDTAAIRARRAKQLPLRDAELATLNQARGIVSGIIDQKLGFPEALRLRAGIIALLPNPTEEDNAQRVADLVSAEGGGAPKPPEGLKGIIHLEDARPVVELTSTHLTVPEAGIWSADLKAHAAQITAAAAAVGYLRGGKHPELPFSGTGFVIGADLVATADFVIDVLANAEIGILPGPAVEFVVADAIGAPASAAFKVTEVVALLPATASRPRMAVLRVPGLAAAGYKPLRVSMPATLRAGLNIGVIGYPSFDARTPQTVLQTVFRNTFGQKRLMVGRLTDKAGASLGEADLFHDAATIGGVGGGPVLDLETGEVIGIHLGGTFADSAKSNFGISMTTALAGPTRSQLGL
jgi:hypothetical protein